MAEIKSVSLSALCSTGGATTDLYLPSTTLEWTVMDHQRLGPQRIVMPSSSDRSSPQAPADLRSAVHQSPPQAPADLRSAVQQSSPQAPADLRNATKSSRRKPQKEKKDKKISPFKIYVGFREEARKESPWAQCTRPRQDGTVHNRTRGCHARQRGASLARLRGVRAFLG